MSTGGHGGNDPTITMSHPIPPTTAPVEARSMLVLLYPPKPQLGQRFLLVSSLHVLGRQDGLDIAIRADSVSRRHAHFVQTPSGWDVEDLGSTNGTYVNHEKVSRRALRDGDICRFGAAILKFLSRDNIEAAYHEEIYRTSIIDAQTGVHNKRFFLEFLDIECAAARRHGHPLTLVLFDIDHFKKVNDAHGHLAGDSVLAEIGLRLLTRVRKEDLIARYGGEEFVCVLTHTDLAGGRAFAESVRGLIASQPFSFHDKQLSVTISAGVACQHPTAHTTPAELIARADEKLYIAKNGGRNRVAG